MKARKQISSRTRFEIFKRDAFACQYCGKTPPGIVLHVDHILAVANGGTNDAVNLITSCQDCNLGKSDVVLETKSIPVQAACEIEKERFEQLLEYNKWLASQRTQTDAWFRTVSDLWISLDGRNPQKFRISGDREQAVRLFLKKLPCERIIDALYITAARIINVPSRSRQDESPSSSQAHSASNTTKFLRYFCGVCWKMVRGE